MRKRSAKPGELLVQWGVAERGDAPALVYSWGAQGASKQDGNLLCWVLEEKRALGDMTDGRSLAVELERRGYDLTTLRFSIQQKPKQPTAEVDHCASAQTTP